MKDSKHIQAIIGIAGMVSVCAVASITGELVTLWALFIVLFIVSEIGG